MEDTDRDDLEHDLLTKDKQALISYNLKLVDSIEALQGVVESLELLVSEKNDLLITVDANYKAAQYELEQSKKRGLFKRIVNKQ